MPANTFTRRSFLGGKSEEAPPPPLNLKNKIGETPLIFPFAPQELPEVPSPTQHIALLGGLNPYTGPWGYAQAAHLLRRTGFGLKYDEVNSFMAMNMNSAVDKILDVPGTLPAPPVNNYNNPMFTDPQVPTGGSWTTKPLDLNNLAAEPYRVESWRGWWHNLMLAPQTTIRERMTLFWHNHFATQTQVVGWGRAVYEHNQMLRANALGNFKTLTKKVTTDGLMLLYLNGFLNKAGTPDENYARELQELFTVGKEGAEQYTEDDVLAAARVLTGWRFNLDNTTYHFPLEHDFNEKKFSAFYNNTSIGASSTDGEAELNAMLDMIFARPEVAEFICRKIYRWFVYYVIDDTIEQNVIQPLAAIFRDNNYEIKPVIETLLKSEHFFEAAQTGCYIKTPVDQAIGTMRSFNLSLNASTEFDKFVLQFYLSSYLQDMSMLPGDPPNVAGWQPFRQVPQYYRMWINGDTIRNRNVFTDVLTAFYIETPSGDRLSFDLLAFASQFSDPGNPVTLVDEITNLLFPQPLSLVKKLLLKSILLSGLPNDSYWTAAWGDYVLHPNDPMIQQTVRSRLLALHLYLMRLPEFQLA
jgi:uncharacterized protein (DUF1800 family)